MNRTFKQLKKISNIFSKKKSTSEQLGGKMTVKSVLNNLATAEKKGTDAFFAELSKLGRGRAISKDLAIKLAQKRLGTTAIFKTKKEALDKIKTRYVTDSHDSVMGALLRKSYSKK